MYGGTVSRLSVKSRYALAKQSQQGYWLSVVAVLEKYSLGLSKGRAKQRATAEGCVIPG